jgi:hypothetical protein
MIKLSTIIPFILSVLTSLSFVGCNSDPTDSETELAGTWTVTSWVEDGTARPEVVSYGLLIGFSGSTMTMSDPSSSFVYSGSYTIDENDHIEAVLDLTTDNSEIIQHEFSVDATLSLSNLTLNGNMVAYSPFWPDNNSTISMVATR